MKKNIRATLALFLCLVTLFLAVGCLSNVNSSIVEADEKKAEEAGVGVKEVEIDGKTVKKYDSWFVEEDEKHNDAQEKKGIKYYILMPVGKLLSLINGIVPSYIFTLFVFAVLMKVLFFWFSYKQQKSMVKQAYFRPKQRAIQNKYKGRTDQVTAQKMQQEILEAQQKEGISPFGGCLPLLIQFPIIILLYEVIRNPLSYVAGYSQTTINAIKNVLCYNDVSTLNLSENIRTAVSSGTAARLTELDLVAVLRDNWDKFSDVVGMSGKTLSGLPNFYAFGNYIDLSVTPKITFEWPAVLYLLIPVITFLAVWLSMKLNRKMTGAVTEEPAEGMPDMSLANKIMDLSMPAMSTVFTFMFPAVLGVYWIFQNILGTLQQFILKKMIPFPVFTEEDYKRAEKEYNKGRDIREVKKKTPSDPNKPKVRSLHHIDDDDEDYPVLPPMKEEQKAQSSAVPKAPLKKEPERNGEGKKGKKAKTGENKEPLSEAEIPDKAEILGQTEAPKQTESTEKAKETENRKTAETADTGKDENAETDGNAVESEQTGKNEKHNGKKK